MSESCWHLWQNSLPGYLQGKYNCGTKHITRDFSVCQKFSDVRNFSVLKFISGVCVGQKEWTDLMAFWESAISQSGSYIFMCNNVLECLSFIGNNLQFYYLLLEVAIICSWTWRDSSGGELTITHSCSWGDHKSIKHKEVKEDNLTISLGFFPPNLF